MVARSRILGVEIGLAILSFLLPGTARALCDYFNFRLESHQVVPPVDSLGWGSSELQLCQDDSLRGYIAIYVEETVTAVQIHGPSNRGENGDLLYDLPVTDLGRVLLGPLPSEQRDWLELQLMYVDVHTTEHPDGALRGQIITLGDAAALMPWSTLKQLYR